LANVSSVHIVTPLKAQSDTERVCRLYFLSMFVRSTSFCPRAACQSRESVLHQPRRSLLSVTIVSERTPEAHETERLTTNVSTLLNEPPCPSVSRMGRSVRSRKFSGSLRR
jgi:hypothetical protein